MKFACSACGTSLRAHEEWVGRAVKCPKCGTRNVVPAVTEPIETAIERGGNGAGDNPLAALTAAVDATTHESETSHHATGVEPVDHGQPQHAPAHAHGSRGVGALGYRRAESGPAEAPGYHIVRIVGFIQQIIGYFVIGIGVLALVGGVAMAANILIKTRDVQLAAGGLTGMTLVGLYLAILGIFLVGAGQVMFCVRDMARNSFYMKRLAERG